MRLVNDFTPGQEDSFRRLVYEEWNEDFTEIERRYSPRIFLGLENDKVVAGMAVFPGEAPEGEAARAAVSGLLPDDAEYLGYFVVDAPYRGRGMGGRFLRMFLERFANRQYWLIIEYPRLQGFYERNGFRVVGEVGNEKILITERGIR